MWRENRVKKKIISLITIIIVLICIGVIFLNSDEKIPEIKKPYTQEYIIGNSNIKGNVDTKEYIEISGNFEIGANKDGAAVFKNPHKAFEYLQKEYKGGLSLIKKQFNLEELTHENYKEYKKYGVQVNYDISDEQMHEAFFVSKFLDIYENSFN